MPGEVTSLGDALILVTYVGAARADCTPEDAVLLRHGLEGPLEDYRAGQYDEDDIIDIVNQLMPTGWSPSGDWKRQLDALGFTPGSAG